MSNTKSEIIVALCGNPNCGKSSIFNRLTGLNQKITNVPGTTIERKTGKFTLQNQKFRLIDTPGTYSIDPKSRDEEEALEIFNEQSDERPDLIVYVADANNLKRNLLFFSQLSELKIPIILLLNMWDVAVFKGIDIDVERLQNELGVKVLTTNARLGNGIDVLKAELVKPQFTSHFHFSEKRENDISQRFERISTLLNKTVKQKSQRELLTDKLDPILTHPIWGYAIFLLVLLIVFQSIFTLAEWPMNWIEYGFEGLKNLIGKTSLAPQIKSLLADGLVSGLAGVLVFIPQIAILIFFMSILEDTGYMARVSFIMDKILRGFGLNGKSVMPMLSGAACAIPAIMATRNIENWKDRIITILITPLMSCSARLPVYTLLISIAVPAQKVWGFVSLQALVLLAMYVIGTVAALVAALAFKYVVKAQGLNYFIMEMPIYHPPRWKNIWMTVWQKSKSFVLEAGKVIIIVSVLLWFLASYGPNNTGKIFKPTQTEQLETSYAGHFGKSIEPAIEPLGFNWKIGIALITSIAAREVFVGTMSTIYSVGSDDETTLKQKLLAEKNEAGKPAYGLATVFSLMIFYAFAMQCISTLAVVYKETKSLKWPIIQFAYMTGLAYLGSLVVFQIWG
ncbi:MAG: ferrous iron transport protein B [Flavobacteriales bacterium]|nr:ferrous iron transport protein B [Flavobacteriales bacterium]